jgi:glucosylglycerate phosphorylase
MPSDRIHAYLHDLYSPEQAEATYHRLTQLLQHTPIKPPQPSFSERDVTLITYGDSLQQDGEAPLKTLRHFLEQHLRGIVPNVHILPFFPYTSDDGFSVTDYYAINPELGTWEDVAALGIEFNLMFDAVINHMSAQSAWFKAFLTGEQGYEKLFFTALPEDDLRSVTRPRTSPLLTPFQKTNGETVYVWTTFSDDQVDLNYDDPETLFKILEVLLFYVQQGAKIIRLDAIAYAGKKIGTSCIHLPQVHTIIKLMRAVLDSVAPGAVIITETNVPHAENISYFGNGDDEAHMVYNFTLPPLLLHTLLSGNANKLAEWVNTLAAPSPQTTFFNFTASHDGIGVRPVEGILSAEELQALIAQVERGGGRVSYKNNPDGSRSPYELNITYFDAVANPDEPLAQQVARFMASQAVMVALAGVPAVYIHSLLGSRNNLEGMQQTGQNRTINRAKLSLPWVEAELAAPNSTRQRVFSAYQNLLKQRIQQAAFHPNAPQRASILNGGAVFVLERGTGSEQILTLTNVTGQPQEIEVKAGEDVLNGLRVEAGTLTLTPYGICWLKA